MKIKVNENETYEINFPEDVDTQQFFELFSRLSHISKMISKDPIVQSSFRSPINSNGTRHYRNTGIHKAFNKDREEAIRFGRLHYHGTKEEKQKVAAECKLGWDDLIKGFSYAKKKWKIKPHELGLRNFPGQGGNVIKEYKDPNFVYKPSSKHKRKNETANKEKKQEEETYDQY